MKPYILLVAGGLIVLAFGGLALWRGGSVLDRADPENADQVAQGKVVYAQHCASCHGDSLQGQPNWRIRKVDGKLPAPPHDDTGHTWHHADEQLFRITKGGVRPPLAPEGYESDMPAFAGVLSDEEIWAALSFLKSTWSKKSGAYQKRIDQAYRKQAKEQ
jgi:mono/diheme cytochrome c family protein